MNWCDISVNDCTCNLVFSLNMNILRPLVFICQQKIVALHYACKFSRAAAAYFISISEFHGIVMRVCLLVHWHFGLS